MKFTFIVMSFSAPSIISAADAAQVKAYSDCNERVKVRLVSHQFFDLLYTYTDDGRRTSAKLLKLTLARRYASEALVRGFQRFVVVLVVQLALSKEANARNFGV